MDNLKREIINMILVINDSGILKNIEMHIRCLIRTIQ